MIIDNHDHNLSGRGCNHCYSTVSEIISFYYNRNDVLKLNRIRILLHFVVWPSNLIVSSTIIALCCKTKTYTGCTKKTPFKEKLVTSLAGVFLVHLVCIYIYYQQNIQKICHFKIDELYTLEYMLKSQPLQNWQALYLKMHV